MSTDLSRFLVPGTDAPVATALTGIGDADVAGMPKVCDALEAAAELVGSRDIVAHNATFDRNFLAESASPHARALRGTWLDSLELARIALPRLNSHRLRDLAAAFSLPPSAHRAAADVEALFGVWRVALAGLSYLPPEVVAAIATM